MFPGFLQKRPREFLNGQVLWGDFGPIFQLAALVRSLTGIQIVQIDFAPPQKRRKKRVIAIHASDKL